MGPAEQLRSKGLSDASVQVADARDLQTLARVALSARGRCREFLVAPDLEARDESVDGGGENTHGRPLGNGPSGDGETLGLLHCTMWGTSVPNRRLSVPSGGTPQAARGLTPLALCNIECAGRGHLARERT